LLATGAKGVRPASKPYKSSMSVLVQKYGAPPWTAPSASARWRAGDGARARPRVDRRGLGHGQTTDELLRLAHRVSAEPSRRELDMLLTTGERVTMALLAMALAISTSGDLLHRLAERHPHRWRHKWRASRR